MRISGGWSLSWTFMEFLEAEGTGSPRVWDFQDAEAVESHSKWQWAKSLRSHLTHYNPMDCSPPGSSVRGDSPGKNIGVMLSSGGSSWPRDGSCISYVSWLAGGFFIISTTWEAQSSSGGAENSALIATPRVQWRWCQSQFPNQTHPEVLILLDVACSRTSLHFCTFYEPQYVSLLSIMWVAPKFIQ